MTDLIEIQPMLGFVGTMIAIVVGGILFLLIAAAAVYASLYRKVKKGTALVRTGVGGTEVAFDGIFVVPIVHRAEPIDISLKSVEIDRSGKNGLICQDNIRADIKVKFFVRVNNAYDDVLKVAQSIGCDRASSEAEIRSLFDAKFSEALKTVGKRFNFVDLYQERDTFRSEILNVIGTDLNGFVLDDAAIDHLEQTPIEELDPDNILDSEGIRKITEQTATEKKGANAARRDEERVIKQQDVEAREAILELERQLAEAEAKQQREIHIVQAREKAEAEQVKHEQWQREERARLVAEEDVQVAQQNVERSVLVAQRNKERTDAVEVERVIRDKELEVIERERMTQLKAIERDKIVEGEKRDIQQVIKERVALEQTVVEEQERIKDTEAHATAEREKQVAITLAEKDAQEVLVKTIKEAEAHQEAAKLKADEEVYTRVKAAEAARTAAELHAEEVIIEAEALQAASEKEAQAKKVLAEAITAEQAAPGLGEALVIEAKGAADAESITKKAEAMKLYDSVGRDHEEFKLELEKEKEIELAEIHIRRDVAAQHASIVGQALKSARIDIVGGDSDFFDKITQSVSQGKAVDRLLENSNTLSDVKETFFNGDPEYFKGQIREWLDDFGFTSEDLKNITISAALTKMVAASEENGQRTKLQQLLSAAERFGLANEKASTVLGQLTR